MTTDVYTQDGRVMTKRIIGVKEGDIQRALASLQQRGAVETVVVPHGDRFAIYYDMGK